MDARGIGERSDAVLRTAMPGHDTAVVVRGDVPLIQLSYSHFQTGMIHRPCCLVGVGCALVFLPLTRVRARSAERRYVLSLAPCGAACRVTGTRASRRSTCGVSRLRDRASWPGPVGTTAPVIRVAFAPPFIQTRPAIEGGPHYRCGRSRGDQCPRLRRQGPRRHTLAPPNKRL
jgi:hypothetical protein